MKKTLSIVSYSIESVDSYYAQIKSLFSNNIIIKKVCIDNPEIRKGIDSDVVLVPSYDMFEKIKGYLKEDTDLIFASRTICKSGLEKIMNIKKGSEVVLIDESPEMTEQMISVIYQLGIRHIDLKSYWTIQEENIGDKTVIILGQSDYMPNSAKEIINIGNSLLDFNSIIDIGMKFDLIYMLNRQDISNSYREVESANFGLAEILGETNSRESQLDILLQVIDAGVIAINPEGEVLLYNDNAKNIVGFKEEEVINRDGIELFNQIPFEYVLKKLVSVEEKIIKMDGYDVVTSVNPLVHSGKLYGAIAVIRKYSDTEKKQHKLRQKLIGKGYKAKYHFNDIIGKSDTINRAKNIARRMAKSNSSILITGETGTGKELFAQAIHNSSSRKKYQFVAVNCGAFPETLLESELFGYEEGAFTGARKGGKPGLFELAHNGTLFLDEITEMPMNLQVKLLRVLQEREIARIGGNRIINVDIRIIAATNKDIKSMVNRGEFREDLYYRLNVLPLKIPPLRARREDILFLARKVMEEFNSDFVLTEAAKEQLLSYNWDGNVRELRNYIEYFVNLGKKEIEVEDLPFYYEENGNSEVVTEGNNEIMVEFLETIGNDIKKYIFVLEELEKAYINKRRVGRRSINKLAKSKGIFLSEQEIRKILTNLERFDMVNITKGRGGTIITKQGRHTLKYFKIK
ncbi:sigma 54-interacting transcriptional regulator [Schnuerera sp. xch1]|uniref:sigma-54 interaction domain-containing protein n=1 Tax=Schnuerera sp. xch1 TaxID=2874283 RepID=UPI001CC04324|nr:sigma 54-interacting transcriptional regulator [Schnuerera sp. xch1]MBZ2174882.1 sigma 54-interacting transcriptional regulator [Schnuerera sp. xch1]